MDKNTILVSISYVIVMVLSLTVHEWAHAYSAFLLGDTTAKEQGRLTLNPLAHIDPIGTILLPLMHAQFGWARPVPFDPRRFRRSISMRTGTMITKSAGPISNVVLAFLCLVVLHLLYRFGAMDRMNGGPGTMLVAAVQINCALAVFNAIPVEPLDGAGVVDRFIPDAIRPGWEQFQRIGPMLLIALFFLPMVLGNDGGISRFIGMPVTALMGVLESVVRMVGL